MGEALITRHSTRAAKKGRNALRSAVAATLGTSEFENLETRVFLSTATTHHAVAPLPPAVAVAQDHHRIGHSAHHHHHHSAAPTPKEAKAAKHSRHKVTAHTQPAPKTIATGTIAYPLSWSPAATLYPTSSEAEVPTGHYEVDVNGKTYDVSNTSLQVTGLQPGKRYSYTINAQYNIENTPSGGSSSGPYPASLSLRSVGYFGGTNANNSSSTVLFFPTNGATTSAGTTSINLNVPTNILIGTGVLNLSNTIFNGTSSGTGTNLIFPTNTTTTGTIYVSSNPLLYSGTLVGSLNLNSISGTSGTVLFLNSATSTISLGSTLSLNGTTGLSTLSSPHLNLTGLTPDPSAIYHIGNVTITGNSAASATSNTVVNLNDAFAGINGTSGGVVDIGNVTITDDPTGTPASTLSVYSLAGFNSTSAGAFQINNSLIIGINPTGTNAISGGSLTFNTSASAGAIDAGTVTIAVNPVAATSDSTAATSNTATPALARRGWIGTGVNTAVVSDAHGQTATAIKASPAARHAHHAARVAPQTTPASTNTTQWEPLLSGTFTTPGPTAPTVKTEPVPQSARAGSTVTFSAVATGIPAPQVQWQISTGHGSGFRNITGATADTYSFKPAMAQNQDEFRAVFVNSAGSAKTAPATLAVTAPPMITLNPLSQQTIAGVPVTFTAAATGSPGPSVQWQVSTDGGATFTNIEGAESLTCSVLAEVAQNGHLFRAVFTNADGSATTAAATLTVLSLV